MASYLLLADTHFADRPPSSCTESYAEDLFDLMAQAAVLGQRLGITAAVLAGDVFHIKAPSRTSHKLVLRLISALKAFECEVFIVPGNHDMQHDRLGSIQTTQPLGVLEEAGFELLVGWQRLGRLYGVPWLQEWSDENVEAILTGYRELIPETGSHHLVVTHAPLYPPGQENAFESYPAARFAAAMGGRGQVFYGHVHEPHGVYTAGGVQFCNNGALSRGSLHEYNMTREVGATLWDDATGEFTFVPLNSRPASEVFRLKEKQQAATMEGRLDEFLSGIASTRLAAVSVESVMESFKGLEGVGQEELALAQELLEEAAG